MGQNAYVKQVGCEEDIVGQIGEKMFTSGRKCNFFHKIAQFDANAGNPDRQHFCPPVLFFLLSLTISLGRFHGKSITQKSDHLQFCSNFRCHFTSGRETTVPNFRRIGQVFLELRPSEKMKFYPYNRASPLHFLTL